MSTKIITSKQHTILMLLFMFRFLNSKQIQQLLKHKDHRRINSWLKDLTEKQYIIKEFKPQFGQLTKPALYYLSTKGRHHCQTSYPHYLPKYLKRIARDVKASKSFKIRCQIIADWYLTFFPDTKTIYILDWLSHRLSIDTTKNDPPASADSIQFFTPVYYPNFNLLNHLKPDAYIRKKFTKGTGHGLLFVFDAYISRIALHYTIKHIFDGLEEEVWEDETTESLQFFFICPNHMIIIYLKKLLPSYLENLSSQTQVIFHLATRNQFYDYKNNPDKKINWLKLNSVDY